MSFDQYVKDINAEKVMFTPGPGALHNHNLFLSNCFGRNDHNYKKIFNDVTDRLLQISGQNEIVVAQGSATLAIEIGIRNFINGRILLINTGFYSERLKEICRKSPFITEICSCNWNDIESIEASFDWIVCCYTETSAALRLDINEIHALRRRTKANLFLDATGSIGLEAEHGLADVVAFSSCKGLFGLTGACFVAYKIPVRNVVDQFYLNLENHRQRYVTGPYHTMQSLFLTLHNHDDLLYSVKVNKVRFSKKFKDCLNIPERYQPLLCTGIEKELSTHDSRVVLYTPRLNIAGSIVCHLGELHLGARAQGDIIDLLEFK